MFVPHHERAAKRSHSAEGFPRGGDDPDKGAASNEEGTRDTRDRPKLPRMFQNPLKQGDGASDEDSPPDPL